MYVFRTNERNSVYDYTCKNSTSMRCKRINIQLLNIIVFLCNVLQVDIRRFRGRWSRPTTTPCSQGSRPPGTVRTSVRRSGTGAVTALSSALHQKRVHWVRYTRLRGHRWAPLRAVTCMTVSCMFCLLIVNCIILPSNMHSPQCYVSKLKKISLTIKSQTGTQPRLYFHVIMYDHYYIKNECCFNH